MEQSSRIGVRSSGQRKKEEPYCFCFSVCVNGCWWWCGFRLFLKEEYQVKNVKKGNKASRKWDFCQFDSNLPRTSVILFCWSSQSLYLSSAKRSTKFLLEFLYNSCAVLLDRPHRHVFSKNYCHWFLFHFLGCIRFVKRTVPSVKSIYVFCTFIFFLLLFWWNTWCTIESASDFYSTIFPRIL